LPKQTSSAPPGPEGSALRLPRTTSWRVGDVFFRGGAHRVDLSLAYFVFAIPSASSFAATSSPAVWGFTCLSISRIFPSGPM
jgi:hypothetical protein